MNYAKILPILCFVFCLGFAPSGLSQSAGLIGHWTFDDPANLGQDTASTNNGTVVGGAYPFVTARIGAGALALDGQNGHIEVPDAPALRFTQSQDYTVAAWVYIMDVQSAWAGIVTKSRDLSPWYGLWLNDANEWVAGASVNLTGPNVEPGWHHSVVVQDGAGGTRNLYVDGAQVASGNALDADGQGALWIGGAVSVTEYFRGLVDDVRLYNRALTDAEISQLATAPMPVTTSPPALLVQPADSVVAIGDKARFSARANALNLSFQWYKGNSPIGAQGTAAFNAAGAEASLTTAALTIADNGATYYVVFSGTSGSVTSRVASVTMSAPVFSPGFLKREFYAGISGATVADLTSNAKFPDSPDQVSLITSFETPSDIDDNYGQRLSGFITPNETADYIFFIASDDQAELYLSTDDTPAAKQLIASEPQWNPSRYWVGTDRRATDTPENRSAPIRLQAGKKYYVEALHKEGTGGDDLAVTAIKSGDPDPVNGSAPLGGDFIGVNTPITGQSITITNQPKDVITNELATVTFTVGATSSGGASLAYQWQRNDADIFKANDASYTTPPIVASDSGTKFRCLVYLPGNVSMTSREALLKVDLDKTPPGLRGVFSPLDPASQSGVEVYVSFDETVDPVSATNTANYSITPAISINSAVLAADRQTVVLAVGGLALAKDYTLNVKNVTDLAAARNVIVPIARIFRVNDLLLHLTFDDPANLGANASGISVGMVVGGAQFSADSRVGGGALQVNGSNGHLEIADMPMFRFTMDQSYSVCAWVKLNKMSGGWRGVVTKSRNIAPWYGIWIDDGTHWVAGGNNLAGPPVTAGWHHAALVQDGSAGTRQLYIDGAPIFDNGTAIDANGTGPIWIGGAVSVSEYLNGLIDDVRIYNRPLTDDEIKALVAAPLPELPVSLSISADLGSRTLQLHWPASATGFGLESTASLSPSNWSAVAPVPVVQGDQNVVTLPLLNGAQFYRLKK